MYPTLKGWRSVKQPGAAQLVLKAAAKQTGEWPTLLRPFRAASDSEATQGVGLPLRGIPNPGLGSCAPSEHGCCFHDSIAMVCQSI